MNARCLLRQRSRLDVHIDKLLLQFDQPPSQQRELEEPDAILTLLILRWSGIGKLSMATSSVTLNVSSN
jgi:hypothetical protein